MHIAKNNSTIGYTQQKLHPAEKAPLLPFENNDTIREQHMANNPPKID